MAKFLRLYGNYKLRKGKFRAIFKVQDQKLILLVLDIGSRGEIYKDL